MKDERFSRERALPGGRGLSQRGRRRKSPRSGRLTGRLMRPGHPGPVTQQIQEVYFGVIKGQNNNKFRLTFIYNCDLPLKTLI